MKFLKRSSQIKSQISESFLEYRPRTFYFIFCESKHLLSPFLKKGFAHCYVIEKLDYIYMMYDPTRCGLNVSMPNCDVSHPLIEKMMKMAPGIKVLEVLTKGNDFSLSFSPKLLTCVSTLEYVSGISFGSFGALTPYRLYKSILKARHPNIVNVRKICQQEEASLRERREELKQRQQQTDKQG